MNMLPHAFLQTAPATIYRVHSDPDFNKLERLIELLSYYGVKWVMYENLNKSLQYLLNSFPNEAYHKVFDRILLRSMKKARYSTEHIHHFALAMETYTHFTSPIRRLCDLIIHYLCKAYLCNSNSQKFAPSQLKHYADVASEQEIQADQSERDIERVYSRTMMQEHEGEIYNGMIISVNSRGLIVQLEEIPVTGVIEEINLGEGYWEYLEREMRYINRRTHQFYQLMDTLFVTISYVDDDIYLLPITKSLRHNVSKAKISWSSQKSGRTTSPSSQKSGRTTSQSSQKPGRTTSPSSQKWKNEVTIVQILQIFNHKRQQMKRAIGIFDSGVGGLTVYKAIRNTFPNEDIIYFGDTARVPYGPKSPNTIIDYSLQNARFLLQQGIKILIVACNTSSAVAIPALQNLSDIPVIGVIEPGAEQSVKVTKCKRIGVIGTEGTIRSGAYPSAIRKLLPEAFVVSSACPLLFRWWKRAGRSICSESYCGGIS